MTKIFIYGKNEEKSISRRLLPVLVGLGGAVHICDGSVTENSRSGVRFLIYETDTLRSLNASEGVFIFKAEQTSSLPAIGAQNALVCIARADDALTMKKLAFLQVPAIVCGSSPRDSVSISSVNGESISVSVQRTLTALDGSDILPCEIKAEFTGEFDAYPLLASASVLLLCGIKSDETLRL